MSADELPDLGALSVDQLKAEIERLTGEERELSAQRRATPSS